MLVDQMNLDIINACFKLCASLFLWVSVYTLYKSKGYAGIHFSQYLFFTVAAVWNLIYYPSLGQMWSFFACISVLAANASWIYLALRYGHYDADIRETTHGTD
jgi:hypothetical protein